MVKRIGRRFVSLLLTFVTILTMLPAMTLPALAATSGTVTGLAVENIGLSFTGDADNAWSANGTTIKGSAKSTSGCSTTHYSSTLTIKNEGSTTARLSFGYTVEVNEGTILVNNATTTANGSFSEELAAGDTVEVKIKSGSTAAATKITMTDVKLEAGATATVTFQPAENGSYTVNGKDITTEAYTNTQSSLTAYKVIATPADGYQFLGWYDATNKSYLPGGASSSIFVSSGNSEVTAIFGKKGTTFQVGTSNLKWDDLNDAIISTRNNSSGYIKQLKSCTISGKYTIPSGVTLLIPFDEAGTLYAEKPAYVASYGTQKVFRKLTMAPGSSITVNGAISVGGQYSQQQKNQGPTGPYGQIDMAAGSSIVLKNGANLYAWGYITGDGQITAESGATVYECFQLRDWRGGTASNSMKKNKEKVFPFSQYYVQNIEAPLTIQYGATEKTYFCVSVSKVDCETTIDFIGSNGLFKLEPGGSITKRYIPKEGRTEYTTNGTASLDKLFVKITVLNIISQDISSNDYALPINGNMTLNIASGKVTSNYDLCLLPGVQINIAKDAELVVAQNASLYVYDSEEWGTYCYPNEKIADVYYSPSPDRYKRTERDLVDAKIDVNGTLTAIGSVYTTESGADICSSEGTGKYVQQSKPGTESTTHQATQNDKSISYTSIPITAAKLKNASADKPYTETSTAKAGDTFIYCKCQDCGNGTWVKDIAAINDSTGKQQTTHNTLQEAVDNLKADQYIKLLHNTTEDINISTRDIYLDLNGRTVTGDISATGTHKLYGMDNTTDEYNGTNPGKIVGKVNNTIAPVFETKLKPTKEYDSLRYVAIKNDAGTEYTFHRFNISVTGYRFELAAPKCALFFIGKFQGDKAARDYLTSLGFTLKDIDGKTTNPRYEIPAGKDIPPMPAKGKASDSEVVRDVGDNDAYLFEAYLMHDIDKENYQTQFSAIAHATFKNSGNSEDNSLSSVERKLSFQQALWDALSAPDMEEKDRKILMNFLSDMNIPNPNP